MANAIGLKKGQNGTTHINEKIPTNGTPVNAVASQGTLVVDTQITATDTIVVGLTEYTFVAGATDTAGEIGIGANVAAAKLAIVAAINGTDTFNTANTLASAAAFATNDCILTALISGTLGDDVVTTSDFTTGTNLFDAVTLGTTTAGVNGTGAINGECQIDDTYLYYCLDVNTIVDANWRRVSLGTAY